jgi:hypothetical protein
VESEPLWNKVSDAQLKAMLAKQGIRHDTTVILYGRDVYAAARVAQILLYAGVKTCVCSTAAGKPGPMPVCRSNADAAGTQTGA